MRGATSIFCASLLAAATASPLGKESSSHSSPPCNSSSNSDGPPYLNKLAKAHGKLWLGTATDQPGTGEDRDIAYQTILNDTRIFGQLTPGNGMKFYATEPFQNVFSYSAGDVVLNIAEDHGKLVRCHNLVWNSQLAPWVTATKWTAAELTAIMKNHITTLITHWGSRCYSWDVINEALASNGSFSSSVWYDTIGPEYFFLAFQFAQEAVESTGQDIKLYYNDYGIEVPNKKTTALISLVKELQSRKIKIDGIGLESHFAIGEPNNPPPTFDQLLSAQTSYTDLGLSTAVTELDVRFNFTAPGISDPPSASNLAAQAQVYYDSVLSCTKTKNCVGTTVWDFDDKYSWIPGTFPGEGAADIYANTTDGGLVRKPAYYAIAQAIKGKSCKVCT